ncbi:MAG: substrate-binding domain-containing protein [Carboxylicivirga sp.]|jgi:molybdenum ABC transporter molybdate-binding protein|nr:substrate-binding domain-containing protein [Carboxylicivirga sp.]
MRNIKKTISLFIAALILLGGCTSDKEKKSILIYSAAGIKPAIEELAKSYEAKYKVRIDIQYGGSGTLLSNMRIAKQGDLYLAADESYMQAAKSFDLLAEIQPLAIMQPVIAVPKGNPKHIMGIDDLFKEETRLALGNPDAASIGRLTRHIFQELNSWSQLEAKASVFKPTVNDVATDIRLGTVDAGIIWDATANQFDAVEQVASDVLAKYQKKVTIGVLKSSQHTQEALKFMRYVSARDLGAPVFKKHGYQPVLGDEWAETPDILFFSGGVNRVAIDKTIQQFEKREGVRVTRVYNGCGILVSQIKAGEKPDAYLSCDVSFMDEVENDFTAIQDVSNTRIVIATQKGNPLKIKAFFDLTQKDLKIGVCNPQQSALGSLTKKMLEAKNIWPAMEPNIMSQTPTADLLVNQLRTGSLDAVIVYEANLSQVMDKVTMVQVTDKEAMAIQNVGLGVHNKYPYTTRRLLDALVTEQSKQNYLSNGFHWLYKANAQKGL